VKTTVVSNGGTALLLRLALPALRRLLLLALALALLLALLALLVAVAA
jgi:hypothetical protein